MNQNLTQHCKSNVEVWQKTKFCKAIILQLKKIILKKNLKKSEPSYTIDGNLNQYNHYGEQYGVSFKNYIELPYDPGVMPRHIPTENHN